MSVSIIWEHDLIADPPAASDQAVREAERALGVRFPADFLAVVRHHQGAAPVPDGISLPNGAVTGMKALLHFEAAPAARNIVNRRFFAQDGLPEGVVPFAEDIGDDLFCFDYRQQPDAPTICFCGVGTRPILIAPSLTAFLAMLHD